MTQAPLVIVADLAEQPSLSPTAQFWLQRHPEYQAMVSDSRRLRALLRSLRDTAALPPQDDIAQSFDDLRDEP